MTCIGILALQGAVGPHQEKFASLSETLLVKESHQLAHCDGLVIPGGESSTMHLLMRDFDLKNSLLTFSASKPVWGVCAGAIMMAQQIQNPAGSGLGMMPIQIKRNAYGRQSESFIASIMLSSQELSQELPQELPQAQEAVFIRAPQITECPPSCRVLAQHQKLPVAIRFKHHLITTFHPELAKESLLHPLFVKMCEKDSG